ARSGCCRRACCRPCVGVRGRKAPRHGRAEGVGMSAVECRSLVHIYKTADLEVFALQGLDMTIEEGEVVAIVGASGSGKTTLMNVLAAVEKPSAGQAVVAGLELGSLSDRSRDAYRRDVIGYVW